MDFEVRYNMILNMAWLNKQMYGLHIRREQSIESFRMVNLLLSKINDLF